MVSRKVESIVFTIMMILSFLGFLILSITLHELSHYKDYHKYADEDSICIANIPKTFQNWTLQDALHFGIGYYEMYYDKHNETTAAEIARIEKVTEIKAYSVTAITFILFFWGLVILVIRRQDLRDIEEKAPKNDNPISAY